MEFLVFVFAFCVLFCFILHLRPLNLIFFCSTFVFLFFVFFCFCFFLCFITTFLLADIYRNPYWAICIGCLWWPPSYRTAGTVKLSFEAWPHPWVQLAWINTLASIQRFFTMKPCSKPLNIASKRVPSVFSLFYTMCPRPYSFPWGIKFLSIFTSSAEYISPYRDEKHVCAEWRVHRARMCGSRSMKIFRWAVSQAYV